MWAFSGNWIIFQAAKATDATRQNVGNPMKTEKGRYAKIENDQNENLTTFCNNSICFFPSVAASVSGDSSLHIWAKVPEPFLWHAMRNTAAEFEFGRRTNDMVGSHGVFGGELILETWQIIDDPSPRFRLGISEGKKSPCEVGENWYSSTHCRIGFAAPRGSLPYFLRLSTNIFAIKTPMDFIFKSANALTVVKEYWSNLAAARYKFLSSFLVDEGWEACIKST